MAKDHRLQNPKLQSNVGNSNQTNPLETLIEEGPRHGSPTEWFFLCQQQGLEQVLAQVVGYGAAIPAPRGVPFDTSANGILNIFERSWQQVWFYPGTHRIGFLWTFFRDGLELRRR